MNTPRLYACISSLLLAALLAGSLRAQTEDVFAFIPLGGKSLLTEAVQDAPKDAVQALLTGKRSRAEWLSYLQEQRTAIGPLQALGEDELLTLADYLAYNMPLPAAAVPADPGKANWSELLPPDGRDLALENCQFCHIITVVVTQVKSKEAWLGTMNKPSHVEIELSPEQREALASYLVVNAGIPEDLVPEELRAGGASY